MIDLVDQITAAAISWLLSAYMAMHDAVLGGNVPLLTLCVTLFVALYGWGIWSGRLSASIPEISGRLAILVIVFLGVTDVGYFNSILRVFFLNVPDGIANALVGAGGTNDVRLALDQCFDSAFRAASAIWGHAGWTDILLNLLGILIIVAVTVFVGYACFLLALSKVATCILLALTPLMFIGLLFPLTRTIFERWLGLLFNFWFVPILTFLVLSFVVHVTQDAAQQVEIAFETTGGHGAMNVVARFLGCCAIAFLLLLQVMLMASTLGGGVALSTMGAAGAAGAWMRNRFFPGAKRYTGGGQGFEGRTRTATGDMRRVARTFGYKRDRDGRSPK